jgi:heat shock protein HslJ
MGDGSVLSGPKVQYAYDQAGSFTVRLKVTDQGGQAGTGTHGIQITPVVVVTPPTAVIYGPSLGETGQQLTFDGSQSKPGTSAIASYDWDMGEGTVRSGPTVQHTYSTAGTYNVTLKVTDQAGESGTAQHSLQVTPVVEVTPPKAAIEGPPTAFVGDSVTFSAAGSQQGTGSITGYAWQSGDGNDTGPAAENAFTTIYAQPGTYYPSVTVVDENGLQDTASTTIVINSRLEGTAWYLANTVPGTSISIEFANGSLSGFAGCNSYSATYTSTRAGGNTNNITIGPITSSQAICSEEIMNQEQAYLAALQGATVYTINGTTLTLTTPSGPLTFGAAVPTPYGAQ